MNFASARYLWPMPRWGVVILSIWLQLATVILSVDFNSTGFASKEIQNFHLNLGLGTTGTRSMHSIVCDVLGQHVNRSEGKVLCAAHYKKLCRRQGGCPLKSLEYKVRNLNEHSTRVCLGDDIERAQAPECRAVAWLDEVNDLVKTMLQTRIMLDMADSPYIGFTKDILQRLPTRSAALEVTNVGKARTITTLPRVKFVLTQRIPTEWVRRRIEEHGGVDFYCRYRNENPLADYAGCVNAALANSTKPKEEMLLRDAFVQMNKVPATEVAQQFEVYQEKYAIDVMRTYYRSVGDVFNISENVLLVNFWKKTINYKNYTGSNESETTSMMNKRIEAFYSSSTW